MRELKRCLILLGILLVMKGLTLTPIPSDDEALSIFEETENEEVHTHLNEEEQGEDIPVNGNVQTAEIGEIKEESKEAAVMVNEFTLEEAQLLMRIAEAEAGNQGEDGMWMVMSVVLNRVKDPSFPNTIKEVIFQDRQFSSVKDGNFEKVKEFSKEAHGALARIEKGEIAPEIIGFETKNSKELDKYFAEAYEYKDHKFYTAKR